MADSRYEAAELVCWQGCCCARISHQQRAFDYIFWIKDKSLADLDSLPDPDVLAMDIIENLQSALEGFQELRNQLAE